MSLRDGVLPSKQSPVTRGDIVPFGDCFATPALSSSKGALATPPAIGVAAAVPYGDDIPPGDDVTVRDGGIVPSLLFGDTLWVRCAAQSQRDASSPRCRPCQFCLR